MALGTSCDLLGLSWTSWCFLGPLGTSLVASPGLDLLVLPGTPWGLLGRIAWDLLLGGTWARFVATTSFHHLPKNFGRAVTAKRTQDLYERTRILASIHQTLLDMIPTRTFAKLITDCHSTNSQHSSREFILKALPASLKSLLVRSLPESRTPHCLTCFATPTSIRSVRPASAGPPHYNTVQIPQPMHLCAP